MRPGQHQQNRRGRGRNNNNNGGNHQSSQNRKGQNPLSRSFESNGPDVKVRGTPAHIAEKYLALARDAQTSGDRVLAENYLQHAEHYNRIIMAYREQFQVPGDQPGGQPRREGIDGLDDGGEDDGGYDSTDEFGSVAAPHLMTASAPQPADGQPGGAPGGQPPPNQQRQPFRQDNQRYDRNGNFDRNNDGQNRDRQFRRDGQQQNRFRDRNDRNDRGNRPYNPNGNGQGDRNFEPRFDRGERQDNRPDSRPDNRPDNRGDFRQPRPDRPVRIDRADHERVQQGHVQPPVPVEAPQPAAPVETSLPAFVAAPPHVAPAPVAQQPAPVAPTPRRRERAAEPTPANSDTPEFLRRPVRRTRAAAAAPPDATVEPVATPSAGEDTKSD